MSGSRATLKRAAAALDRLRPPPPGLVVLIYHRVGGRVPMELDLPTPTFEAQMSHLAEHAAVGTLDEGLAAVEHPPPRGGERPVAVTFDDGTADFVEDALPVLVRHRIPVTLYLATAFVEEQRPFPGDGRPLSWAALADACSTGLVSIGSHTHSHALLDRVDPRTAADELERSTALITERLGVVPAHFAYPKALAPRDPAVEAEVRTRFVSAAVSGTRPNRPGRTDRWRLRRSPVQRSDGMQHFSAKVAGGMWFEDAARAALNRWRYRGART